MYDSHSVYGSTPQSMSGMDSSDRYRTPKESIEYIDDVDLDDQLMRLTKEKEKVRNLEKRGRAWCICIYWTATASISLLENPIDWRWTTISSSQRRIGSHVGSCRLSAQ